MKHTLLENIVLVASVLTFISSCQSKDNEKPIYSVYDAILEQQHKSYGRYNEYIAGGNEHYVNPPTKQDNVNYKFYTEIQSYYANIDNKIFAVGFTYPKGWFSFAGIQIEDEYISRPLFSFNSGNPRIFYNNILYTLEDAVAYGVVDFNIVRTFDDFSNKHSPEELKSIPFEVETKKNLHISESTNTLNNGKKPVSQIIKEAKCQKSDNEEDRWEDYTIVRYLGRKDNCFAVLVKNYKTFSYGLHFQRIKIEDYVSSTYYEISYFPEIYYNDELYSVQESLDLEIIDLDFVKTFDSFFKEHSSKELDNIYFE